jgi:hypothetical protein
MNSVANSIDFNPSMQIHQPGLELKSNHNVWPTIRLKATANSLTTFTTIAFNNMMTKGLDPTYDAGLLRGGADLIIYTRLVEDNGIPFVIQALPDLEFSNMIIPIGLESKSGGEVLISAESLNLPANCQVILEDKLLNKFTDLSLNNYSATIEAKSLISDRFRLHTSYLTTNTDTEIASGNLNAYAIRNSEMIIDGKVSDEAIASIYDVVGRLILTTNLKSGNRNTIKLPMIRTGIYLLSIRDGGKIFGLKIPVRE